MQITTVGIDLAKNVFQVHGVNERGKALLKKRLRRDQLAAFFVNLPPCLIGMEACGSAHHWARKLQSFGHTVRLMAPQFVKPYVKSNKNDAADAEAICEAVARPTMRFVPIKNVEQQSALSLHRVRQGFVKARTAQANQIRGLLGERGGAGNPDTAISGYPAISMRAKGPRRQDHHEQKTPQEPLTAVQGQGGPGRDSRREDLGRVGQAA